MLQMEIFAAFLQNPAKPELAPKINFFTEEIIDENTSQEDCVFYERNISLLKLEPKHFTSQKEPINLIDIYKGTYNDLSQKLNNPRASVPFLIKTYVPHDNALLMNKHIEIVGFLHFPKEYHPIEEIDNEYFGEKEHRINNYFAPIIHALSVKSISPFENIPKELQGYHPNPSILRRLHDIFIHKCRGDQLLSQILLYSMVSLVTNRPYNMPIDLIPLNIYNITDQESANNIMSLAKMFCPYPTFIKVDLKELGKTRWYGKKNYDYNCIEQGLNLPNGSTLIMDETQLEIGTLHEVGVKNATLVNGILANQKLYYDFDYCTFEAECNCGVLCLSKGKSIFDFEYRVDIILIYRSLLNHSL